LLKKINRYHW